MLKLKAIIFSFIFIVYTFAASAWGLFVVIFQNRPMEDFFLRFWANNCLRLLGVRVEVEGEENIPKGGALYLFNHASFLDIIVITAIMKIPLRFGAKEELFKVPIMGACMRACRYLPIARGRREEVIEVYKEAEKRFANGESFILAPEGKRQDQEEIGEFKSGPFVFAIDAKVPLVPIVLSGAYDLMPPKSFIVNRKAWISTVKVKILPPVETANFTFEDRKKLADGIREDMIEELKDLQGKKKLMKGA